MFNLYTSIDSYRADTLSDSMHWELGCREVCFHLSLCWCSTSTNANRCARHHVIFCVVVVRAVVIDFLISACRAVGCSEHVNPRI